MNRLLCKMNIFPLLYDRILLLSLVSGVFILIILLYMIHSLHFVYNVYWVGCIVKQHVLQTPDYSLIYSWYGGSAKCWIPGTGTTVSITRRGITKSSVTPTNRYKFQPSGKFPTQPMNIDYRYIYYDIPLYQQQCDESVQKDEGCPICLHFVMMIFQ